MKLFLHTTVDALKCEECAMKACSGKGKMRDCTKAFPNGDPVCVTLKALKSTVCV